MREQRDGVIDDGLMRIARRWATTGLTADDVLLGIVGGQRLRFRTDGVDHPVVTPKRWARAIPATRGFTLITFTDIQVLAVGDGFAANGHLSGVFRAEMVDRDRLTLAFLPREGTLALLELGGVGELNGHRFAAAILASRDAARAGLEPRLTAGLAGLDELVQSRTLDELWSTWPVVPPR